MSDGQVVDHYELGLKNTGRIKANEDRLDRMDKVIDAIAVDVSEIKTTLLNRPTIGQLWAFSIMTFIATAGFTYALTVLNLVIKVGN